jgi:hypothetical protein
MKHAGYSIPLVVLLMHSIGCASIPVSTSLPAVVQDPDSFRNKHVEITAPVLENHPPKGDNYRTWSFEIGKDDDHRITASEEGYNPSTIDRAYYLVEEAQKSGEPITITGKLRVGPYQALESGMEIELISVRYRGMEIKTDKGPFVRDYYYPYYHGSLFLHYGHQYHRGRHYRHGHHHW